MPNSKSVDDKSIQESGYNDLTHTKGTIMKFKLGNFVTTEDGIGKITKVYQYSDDPEPRYSITLSKSGMLTDLSESELTDTASTVKFKKNDIVISNHGPTNGQVGTIGAINEDGCFVTFSGYNVFVLMQAEHLDPHQSVTVKFNRCDRVNVVAGEWKGYNGFIYGGPLANTYEVTLDNIRGLKILRQEHIKLDVMDHVVDTLSEVLDALVEAGD